MRTSANLAEYTGRRGSEAVQTVQTRDLVRLGEGRVVEDRVPEVLDRAPQREHGLSDVDDLGGVLPDRVHAQELQALRVEEDLPVSYTHLRAHETPEHL